MFPTDSSKVNKQKMAEVIGLFNLKAKERFYPTQVTFPFKGTLLRRFMLWGTLCVICLETHVKSIQVPKASIDATFREPRLQS